MDLSQSPQQDFPSWLSQLTPPEQPASPHRVSGVSTAASARRGAGTWGEQGAAGGQSPPEAALLQGMRWQGRRQMHAVGAKPFVFEVLST